jgi:hypothetical protein
VLLRAPTMGETSGSAIRTLSLGKPVIVSDLGWFGELPDDVAFKVPVGDGEEAALVDAFERLAEPGVAEEMGEAARRYVGSEHDVDRVAEQYVAALEQTAGSGAVEAKVLYAVAAAAADTGVDPVTLEPELSGLGLTSPNGSRPGPGPRQRWISRWPMWAWLCGLYAAAVVVQLALALRVVSPWIMTDELVYSDMARSFAETGRFLVRGVHANYGFVYPLLISPAYALFGSVGDAFVWVQALNVLAMCSVVFPVYLLARRVVRPSSALVVAALAVAVPPLVYAGTVMTENAFYPISAWLAYALVLALEQPTLRRQLVLLAVCALAFLTRAQAVALIAAALTAPLLLAWIERGRPRRLGAWKPLYGVVGAAAALAVVVEVARGRSPSELLGGYSVATQSAGYHWWTALRWIVYHVAALDLSLYVLPFAALIVIVASARHLDRPLRVFSAAAASLTFWLVLEVGVFASKWSERIEERNLFYLAPLFLVALLAWIERGQPKPPRAAVAAAGLAAALPGAIPFTSLMNINAQSDTLFIQPWWYLGDRVVGGENVALLAVLLGVALGAAFLWLPRRYAPALPVVVAAGFLVTWLPLQLWIHSFPRLSAASYVNGIGAQKSWIDAAVGRDADVTIVWSGGNPFRGWENEFWNRSIRRAYDLGSDTLLAGATEPRATVEKATGILLDPEGRPIRASYVLADRALQIDGTEVASDPNQRMALYRVDGPIRAATSVSGWYQDSWTGPRLEWRRLACKPGTLTIPVHSDAALFAGVTQQIRISGTTTPSTVSLPSTADKTIVVHLVPKSGTCSVVLDVSPTRRPSDVPALNSTDIRRLGVLVGGLQYAPATGA